MELKFHTSPPSSFYREGVLQEEPEDSLKTLMHRYEQACESHVKGRRKMVEAARPYTRMQWISETEPTFYEDTARNYAHRTWRNAEWSDITLALAADFESPGEITTRRAAGGKYIGYPLPENLKKLMTYPMDALREAEKVARLIAEHPCCKPDGIRLNIAGNGAAALKRFGVDTDYVATFIYWILYKCKDLGIHILEVRSGGQTGVDEAGIKAAQQSRMKCSILAPKGFRMRDADGRDLEGRGRFVKRFKEEVIDQAAWEKAHGDEKFSWDLAEFNGFNGIDMLEWDIDLKIMHINERKKMNNQYYRP